MHEANILIHIVAGAGALLLGLLALASIKGGKLHNSSGRYFLWLMGIVILTGLLGVFVFDRNVFLLVITVLSAYLAFSGYRCLILKTNSPRVLDIFVAVLSALVLGYSVLHEVDWYDVGTGCNLQHGGSFTLSDSLRLITLSDS